MVVIEAPGERFIGDKVSRFQPATWSCLAFTDISFEPGFTNLPNFNRQFRLIYHDSPVGFSRPCQNQAVK